MANPIDGSRIDAAIARVLTAEQAARDRVSECARDAQAQIDDAQRRAREIARRAAQRTARVHRWADDRLAAELAALAAEQRRVQGAPVCIDPPQHLQQAVAQLAAELTGGTP